VAGYKTAQGQGDKSSTKTRAKAGQKEVKTQR